MVVVPTHHAVLMGFLQSRIYYGGSSSMVSRNHFLSVNGAGQGAPRKYRGGIGVMATQRVVVPLIRVQFPNAAPVQFRVACPAPNLL